MNKNNKTKTNKKKVNQLDKKELKDLVAYQVFLICFKNTTLYNFFDILDKLGDYKTICKGNEEYAVVNTSIKVSKIKKLFDKNKKPNDIISIIGLTLDMMENFADTEVKNWCLQRQFENMQFLLSQIKKDNNITFDDYLNKIRLEIEKVRIENEKVNKGKLE